MKKREKRESIQKEWRATTTMVARAVAVGGGWGLCRRCEGRESRLMARLRPGQWLGVAVGEEKRCDGEIEREAA